jgi:hypothetical protein
VIPGGGIRAQMGLIRGEEATQFDRGVSRFRTYRGSVIADTIDAPKKRRIMKVLVIAAVFALGAGAASAQQLRTFGTLDRGYTVQTPGHPPTYVTPTPGGGYTFQTPGQLPTYAAPNDDEWHTPQQPDRAPASR